MSLIAFAVDDPEGFLALCDKLRERGVVKLGPLILGALPPKVTHHDRDVDPDADARRKHEVMFAACRTRPTFEPRVAESDTPKAVVQRRARDEALRGKAIT